MEPGVYPLVDLRTDPIDQALCDRTVIVAAKFVMHCCYGSDGAGLGLSGAVLILEGLKLPTSTPVPSRSVRNGHLFNL
jgi:hypothetical protein